MASAPDIPVTVSGVTSASVPSWAGDPTVWLAQMDAFFTANKVTSQNLQYSFLVSSLPPALTVEVKDILTSPPGTYSCDQLKAEIINHSQTQSYRRETISL